MSDWSHVSGPLFELRQSGQSLVQQFQELRDLQERVLEAEARALLLRRHMGRRQRVRQVRTNNRRVGDMQNLSLKARLQTYFKVRSVARDASADQSRVAAVAVAIENALNSAENEYAGLKQRIDQVRARAAIIAGNGVDEYSDREITDSRNLNAFETEMANGDRRLAELAATVGHFKFLKTVLLARFPDFEA